MVPGRRGYTVNTVTPFQLTVPEPSSAVTQGQVTTKFKHTHNALFCFNAFHFQTVSIAFTQNPIFFKKKIPTVHLL